MISSILAFLIIVILSTGIYYFLATQSARTSEDVLVDISQTNFQRNRTKRASLDQKASSNYYILSGNSGRVILGDELSRMGLFDVIERRRFKFKKQVSPILMAIANFLIFFVVVKTNIFAALLAASMGLAITYLYGESKQRAKANEFEREIERYLPIVMERIVMAVEAGLDVLASLSKLQDFAKKEATLPNSRLKKKEILDPVTKLLGLALELTESGLVFEDSLKEVASSFDSSALRHAFIHLGIAHKQGGELVAPLKELSDATQSYYQDSVEEEIAKLPVHATLPLVCTFAGLITFFITTPLLEVFSILTAAVPK